MKNFHQLEINAGKREGSIKAHLDFTLVWEQPVKAVRILEIKSTDRLPDDPWQAHEAQVQGQVDLLRYYWNKPVFRLRDKAGAILHENLTFPQICREILGLDIPRKAGKMSVES